MTLSRPASDFARIDIVYAKVDGGSGGRCTCTVHDPDGKKASFCQVNYVAGANAAQIVYSMVAISVDKIYWQVKGSHVVINCSTFGISTGLDEGEQLIYKVVGYKA